MASIQSRSRLEKIVWVGGPRDGRLLVLQHHVTSSDLIQIIILSIPLKFKGFIEGFKGAPLCREASASRATDVIFSRLNLHLN